MTSTNPTDRLRLCVLDLHALTFISRAEYELLLHWASPRQIESSTRTDDDERWIATAACTEAQR